MKKSLTIGSIILTSLILTACGGAKIDATYHNNQTGISEYIDGSTNADKLYMRTESDGVSKVKVNSKGKFNVSLVPKTSKQTIDFSDSKSFDKTVSIKTDAVKPVMDYEDFMTDFNAITDINIGSDAIQLPEFTDGSKTLTDDLNIEIDLNVEDGKLLGFNVYTKTTDEDLFDTYVVDAGQSLNMSNHEIARAFNKAQSQKGQYITASSNGKKMTFIANKDGSMTAFTRMK